MILIAGVLGGIIVYLVALNLLTDLRVIRPQTPKIRPQVLPTLKSKIMSYSTRAVGAKHTNDYRLYFGTHKNHAIYLI